MDVKYEPRRKDRRVGQDECLEILARGAHGVLATVGEDGEPYPVPLSYVFLDGKIYFHCARKGRKIDNLRVCSRVGFTVVGRVQPLFEENFSTQYESVIVFGQAGEVTGEGEKYTALYALAEKYLPEHIGKADDYIKRAFSQVAVYTVVPERMSGKARHSK
ncbi:MAG: pyridoxamine 5'-phosphate oxidase family protein [Candidatus Accumulibacter sp.]|jgi:nitroimidazol reductase NimA-like FMN-containing flavoprotein (pyridoxamine 5'-phosphate oxidase superfamily)|nr:pyridoxamine 5'-phosphate oxidase family protein [Accumulibacter sp.]